MKKILTTTAIGLIALAANSQTFEWVKPVQGTGINKQGNDVAVDAQKNVYTIGIFRGTADFDPGAGTFNLTSNGTDDVYIQKLDSLGNFIWAVSFGGTTGDEGLAITIAPNGNIYAGGAVTNTADIDPGAGTVTIGQSGYLHNAFILELNPAGAYVSSLDLTGGGEDFIADIVVNAANEIYVSGITTSSFDADPSSDTATIASAGNMDGFVLKYSSSYTYLNGFRFGAGNPDVPFGLSIDTNGDLLVTGYYRGTVDFDPTAGVSNLICVSMTDIFVAKYNSDLNVLHWVKSMGGTSDESGNGIVTDGQNNCYITGSFKGTVDFDPGSGVTNLTASYSGMSEVYILKLDANGNFVWVDHLNGGLSGNKIGNDIAIDELDNIYIAGEFEGSMNLDPASGNASVVGQTGPDMFISSYTSAGLFRWGFRVGSVNYERALGVCYSSNGLQVTGTYGSTITDFDPGIGVSTLQSTSGTNDAFTARYHAGNPNTSGIESNGSESILIAVYPNPCTDYLTIETTEQQTLIISDISGRIVNELTVNGRVFVPVQDLQSGIYFIRSTNHSQAIRFVKE